MRQGSELQFVPAWGPQWNSAPSTSKEKLQGDLEMEHVEVGDTTPSCCASSLHVLVVSAKFKGKPLLQRHQLVNTCPAEELLHVHAFEQKTLTPGQWAREQQK